MYALILQPDNIVYLWSNRVQILAVSDGWTEAFCTQQNKSRVHFRPSHRRLQNGSYTNCQSWTHFNRYRKHKCVL